MRVLVVGTGIIGTIFGWALQDGGHEVVHFVRKGKSNQFKNGIQLDILDNRKHKKNFKGNYAINVIETITPDDHFDAVIIPTKPYQVLNALKGLKDLCQLTKILLLTQNWSGTSEIDEIIPKSNYIYGDAHAGGVFKNNELIGVIYNDIILGKVDSTASDAINLFENLFNHIRLKVKIPENILHYIWIQYAINAGLWTGLVRAGSLEKLFADKETRRLCLLSVKECLAVVKTRGVPIEKYSEAKLFSHADSKIGGFIAGVVLQLMFKFNKSVQRSSAHGLGDSKEIVEAYNCLIFEGNSSGIPMPVTLSFKDEMSHFYEQQH